MFFTGLRVVGELTGLTWDDLNFENNLTSVNKTITYYVHEDGASRLWINTPKTKSSNRTVPKIESVKMFFMEEKQFQKDLKIYSTQNI